MNFPAELKYTRDHEWVNIKGAEATVGITEFAQRELGDIVYVDINTVGQEVEEGAVFGTVEAVKTVSDLFMPLAGTIQQLNPDLDSSPELINTDPYGEGWMVKITLSDPAAASGLLTSEEYRELVGA